MGSTGRDLHVDIPLSNVAIAYKPMGMIADQIAPIVPVPKQSDAYTIWNLADVYRVEDTKRAPATEANIITRSVSSGTFFCDNYALKDRIPYEDLENADAGMILTERSQRIEYIKDHLMLDMELRVANLCTSTSNVGSSSTISSAWTDYTAGNSDPIGDINTAINNIEDATGQRPNSVLFGRYAWRNFREHADVIDRIYGNETGANARVVNMKNVMDLFELERALVGGAYQNTADEGQTAVLSQMWNDNVLLYYAPPAAAKNRPSFMYSFRWNKVKGFNMAANIFQDEKAAAEEIQLGYYQDEVITASALGYLLTGVGSSQ